MCVSLRSVYNQSKIISEGMPFKLSVPCGRCHECQLSLSSQYHLRSFYEAMSCINKGGFCYMETLTYDDDHLPHLSSVSDLDFGQYDYPCFSYRDLRLFFVRLRQLLRSDGFDVNDKLRYFASSEYGSDPSKTRRPHYHIIFYCNIPGLSSYVLSSYISRSWQFGRTDGCPYHGRLYVEKHTFDSSCDHFALNSAINYVSKYVEKQRFYQDLLDSRWSVICSDLKLLPGTSKFNEYKSVFYRLSQQFHRQSLGFGLSALDDPRNSFDNIFRTGCMSYVTNKGLKRIPLPQYFSRKLFYDLVRYPDKSLRWSLNDKGVAFHLSRLDCVVESYRAKLFDLYRSMEENDASYFNKLLDGRSLLDFARYVLCYKGRLMDVSDIYIPPYDGFIVLDYPHIKKEYFNYQTLRNKHSLGLGLVSLRSLDEMQFHRFDGSSFCTYRELIRSNHLNGFVRPLDFVKRFPFIYNNDEFMSKVVTQDSCFQFRHFDSLFNFISSYVFSSKARVAEAYAHIQELRDKFKFY